MSGNVLDLMREVVWGALCLTSIAGVARKHRGGKSMLPWRSSRMQGGSSIGRMKQVSNSDLVRRYVRRRRQRAEASRISRSSFYLLRNVFFGSEAVAGRGQLSARSGQCVSQNRDGSYPSTLSGRVHGEPRDFHSGMQGQNHLQPIVLHHRQFLFVLRSSIWLRHFTLMITLPFARPVST